MTTMNLLAIEGNCLPGESVERRRVLYGAGGITARGRPVAVWRLANDEVLLPAFHDHHTHLAQEFIPPRGPMLHGSRSRSEALDEVRLWLRAHPGATPVLGEGWDESVWEDARPLHRAELDAIDSVRPIALRRVCGHLATLNSGAWSALNPEGSEADPVRGIITEMLALSLPQRWPVAFDEAVAGALRGQRRAAELGVCGIDEMGTFRGFEVFERLQREGKLRLHVRHFFPLAQFGELIERGLSSGFGRGRLHVAGCKTFLDGSFGARTAAIDSPYEGSTESGILLWERSRLLEAVRAAAARRYSVALHAIGIRAVEQALSVFEEVGAPSRSSSHRIEHVEQIDDDSLARGAAAGIVWSMQPNFTVRWQNEGGMYERLLGAQRARSLNRYRSVMGHGSLLFGSDTMPMDPLFGMVGSLTHPDPLERLSVCEAFWAYTRGGLHRGTRKDLLASGEPADLVVLQFAEGDLDRSLRHGTARVVWTAAGGGTVWCDPAAAAPPVFQEIVA